MLLSLCVVCNVPVQPREVEWAKHTQGKAHKKKVAAAATSTPGQVGSASAAALSRYTEAHFPLKEVAHISHASTLSSTLVPSSSLLSVRDAGCDAQQGTASSGCLRSPTEQRKPLLTASSYIPLLNKNKNKQQVNGMVSIPSKLYSNVSHPLASYYVAHFNPHHPRWSPDICVFSERTQALMIQLCDILPKETVAQLLVALPCKPIPASMPTSSSSHSSQHSSQPHFEKLCKCCDVTLYSQVRWHTHCATTDHQERQTMYNDNARQQRYNNTCSIINARCDAIIAGRPVPNESQYDWPNDVRDDDEDDGECDGYSDDEDEFDGVRARIDAMMDRIHHNVDYDAQFDHVDGEFDGEAW